MVVNGSMSIGWLKALIAARFEVFEIFVIFVITPHFFAKVPASKVQLNVEAEDFLTLRQAGIRARDVIRAW